jgi:hypothetical protein
MNSAAVRVGQFLTTGVWLPRNKSGHPAVFERLEPLDSEWTKGLEIRYGAVHLPQRTCQVGAARGWPVPGCGGLAHPVGGFVYRDGEYAAQILVGIRSSTPRTWTIPAFRLRYRIGGHRYAAVYFEGTHGRVVRGSGFSAGTRDIGCEHDYVAQTLRCDISAAELKPPPRLSGCNSGIPGGYVLLPSGTTKFYCRETLMLPSQTILPVGTNWRQDRFSCRVVALGRLRCRNADGHGFFLSRQHSYRF